MSDIPLNLVWCDLEFTDTDPQKAHIMQCALWVTTPDLIPLSGPTQEGPIFVDVRLTQQQADSASEWVKEHQAALLVRCQTNPDAIDLEDLEELAERYVLETCQVARPGNQLGDNDDIERLKPLLAGNSIHSDYRLIQLHLKRLAALLSYRLLDVTTLKEIARRWRPEIEFDRRAASDWLRPLGITLTGDDHDARHDLMCSIAELNFYRENLLR